MVFGNIVGFLGVNWAQKWTKTITFGYVSFLLNHLIRLFRDCLYLMKDVPLVEISGNLSHICRRKSQKSPEKWPFHECCIATKTFEITLMKLTAIMYLHKTNLNTFWCVMSKKPPSRSSLKLYFLLV